MKIFTYKLLSVMIFLGISAGFTSCNDEPGDSPFVDPSKKSESTILMYAIATNNLFKNYLEDKSEIEEAAQYIDLNKNNILIYELGYKYDEDKNSYVNQPDASLLKLKKKGKDYVWETIKKYDTATPSLEPSRISEVVDLVFNQYPAENQGMFFWSHSSAAQPYLTARSAVEGPSAYSFGIDETEKGNQYERINVDELANALPDHLLNFIWFDSCYMGNVESAYQMRNKCNYYVGYATEVWEWGLQYTDVLPYLTRSEPQFVEAAQAFFNFYDNQTYYRNATISVNDMSKIELLADFCKQIYVSGINVAGSSSFIKYTTSGDSFYDLGDYTKYLASKQGIDLSDQEWDSVLEEFQLYRAATPFGFNHLAIPEQRFSGLSTHLYDFNDTSDREMYYQKLDWFKRVFK